MKQWENAAKANVTHGMTKTRVFRIWSGMWTRCRNPRAINYANYGGRGITVCKRWNSFSAFLSDMGEPPRGATLERKDTNGNYELSNCEWATRQRQARNRRNNRLFCLNGVTACSAEWAQMLGISRAGLMRRIDILKWPLERALTTGRTR